MGLQEEGADGLISPESYTTIYGWMITELGLTGNDLLIYAAIFSFSSAEREFTGGIRYLREWTGCAKNTVLKSLQNLQDADLIERVEVISKHGRSVHWRCKNWTMGGSIFAPGWFKSCTMGGSKFDLPSINDNYNANIYNNIYNAHAREIEDVISHLNEVTGSAWTAGEFMPATRILELLQEGYAAADLKAVIDHKAAEWKRDPKMYRYLRPSTLFGDKFPKYLAEARAGPKSPSPSGQTSMSTFDTDELFEAALAHSMKLYENMEASE